MTDKNSLKSRFSNVFEAVYYCYMLHTCCSAFIDVHSTPALQRQIKTNVGGSHGRL